MGAGMRAGRRDRRGRVRRELLLPPDRPGRAGRRAPRAGDARLRARRGGPPRSSRRSTSPRTRSPSARGPSGVFQRLEREHALPFVHHGYLRLGHSAADVAGFHESVALQRAHGLHDARVIEPDEIARIVPALRVDDLAGALWGSSDGYVDAVRYCELLAGLGRAAGGRVLQGRRATGLRLRGGRVAAVECDGETIECETVVNASGAWARRLGGDARADAARRRLSAPAGPVRAAAAPRDARARW